MITSVDIYGKLSFALAIIGAILPFLIILFFPDVQDSTWIKAVYTVFFTEFIALSFGLIGWDSLLGKIGFALAILITVGFVSYNYLPSI